MAGRRSAAADARPGAADAAARDPLDALAELLSREVERLGAHVGALYLPLPGEPVMELAVLVGLPRDFARPWERVGFSAPVPSAEAVRTGRLVWVGGEEEMARRYPRVAVAVPYPFGMAAAPVATPAGSGAVMLLWPGTHSTRLSPEETRGLTGLADRLAGELARAARRAGAPLRAGEEPRVVSGRPGGTEPPEVLAALLHRLPEGLCALDTGGRLTFVSPTAAELLGEPVDRLLGELPWTVLPWLRDPVYEGRYRAAMLSRQPASFVALCPPDRWLAFDLHPDASGLSVRITRARVAHGDAPAVAVPPPAPIRAGALHHILHLATALTEATGVQDVVDLLAGQIVPAFGGQGLALLAAEDGRLRVVGHHGCPETTIERLHRSELSAPAPEARTATSGAPAFFACRQELEHAFPARTGLWEGMGAWAFLPLVAYGRAVGSCVLAFARPHRFDAEERTVLTSLGGLIAQALERAHLYDAKLELAHGLQESLLPHELPLTRGLAAAARYLPGTRGMDIGGDFYDLIRLGRDTVGAVIGDVQGHNVTAAALMGQVRTAVHAYATAGADPAEVLARTNRLLTDLDPGLFASCLYLHLDLRARRVLLASAGHTQPLLRAPDGRTRVLDVPGGLLLGIEPAVRYPLVRLPLAPGSLLVLYTDGLVERPGVDLDDAVATLADQVDRAGERPLEDLADLLVGHAEQSGRRDDDMAVLLLRPEPAADPPR
ncbi:SpoIIE family protein phosphatase [Streptomyces sp. NPDC092296]|uniref:SpoIIE family protein phosphatase n=1 Tax=Streptomyces sp. NPDC092296 TaxID=3366012 RepID=UPI003803D4C6